MMHNAQKRCIIKLDILSDSSNGASLDGLVLAGGQVMLPEKQRTSVRVIELGLPTKHKDTE